MHNSKHYPFFLSKLNNNAGRNIRLKSIAKTKVIANKVPKATVPPKVEKANTPKPKNRIIAV